MSITANGRPLSPREDLGAWDPVEYHEVDGVRLAVTRKGRGPALVCLHATGHGARDYEDLAARVGDAFEVIAVDWPGQGRSGNDVHPASAARYSRLLEELLPRLGAAPAIVVGCSIGGAAAIETAARRSDLVRALVLCDPGGLVAMDRKARFAIGRMTAFFAAGARGAAWFPPAFALYYRMVLPRPAAAAQRRRIVAAARDQAAVLAQAWASFADADADLRRLVPSVLCPTLFAWARQDRILPWSASREAAEKFANHRVEFFRGGHAAFLEDPENFDRSLRRFAAGLAA